MTSEDIGRICWEVQRMSQMADWSLKGMPVISWQFATISEFARARADLLMAMTPEIAPQGERERERLVSSEVTELECFGVIFQLSCPQQYMTRGGPMGANEVPVVFRKGGRFGL